MGICIYDETILLSNKSTVLTIFTIMELLNTIINFGCEFYDYDINMSLQLVGPSIQWPSQI